MRRIAWRGCWLLVGLFCLRLTPSFAAEPTLIDFDIDDQFEQEHKREDFAGRVVLVIGGDRNGFEFREDWTQAIRSELALAEGDESIAWLTVPNMKGVPFFLKGMLRGKFSQEPENWMLMDWGGRFAKAYEWVEDEVNILVFDRSGTRSHQMHGTGVIAASVEQVCDALRQACATTEAGGPGAADEFEN